MNLRYFGLFVLAVFSLAGCAGGGSNTTLAGANVAPPVLTPMASGTLTVVPPRGASTKKRRPLFVSASTTGASMYVGSTPFGGAGTSPHITCSPSCTFHWVAPSGSQTFSVELDDGTNVLAEGRRTYTIAPGTNTLSPSLTLNGVAATLAFGTETLGGGGTTFGGTFAIADFDGNAITSAGSSTAYDNGTPTFASSDVSVGTITIAAQTPTATGTDHSFSVACAASATGTFAIAPTPGSGSGAITAAQLTATSLTYPSAITGNMYTYTCTDGQITDSTGSSGFQ
ncbi:MAG: hypothetical protein JO164_02665 [Candidatus Eremiobacteraeota bacterium]|nr:hypothetical protein [Candidatus Eremiobacteraeota bacterium]